MCQVPARTPLKTAILIPGSIAGLVLQLETDFPCECHIPALLGAFQLSCRTDGNIVEDAVRRGFHFDILDFATGRQYEPQHYSSLQTVLHRLGWIFDLAFHYTHIRACNSSIHRAGIHRRRRYRWCIDRRRDRCRGGDRWWRPWCLHLHFRRRHKGGHHLHHFWRRRRWGVRRWRLFHFFNDLGLERLLDNIDHFAGQAANQGISENDMQNDYNGNARQMLSWLPLLLRVIHANPPSVARLVGESHGLEIKTWILSFFLPE